MLLLYRILFAVLIFCTLGLTNEIPKLWISPLISFIDNQQNYIIGGVKGSYPLNKFLKLSTSYFAQTSNHCAGEFDCDWQPNSWTLYELLGFSGSLGAYYSLNWGYISGEFGIGSYSGEQIKYEIGEVRRQDHSFGFPMEMDLIFLINRRFGFGVTGFLNFNKFQNISGVMANIQLRLF